MFRIRRGKYSANSEGETQELSPSFMNAVMTQMNKRREYPRIRYPSFGPLGNLPSIGFQDHILKPIDLSLGGLMIENPHLDASVGDKFTLRFYWLNGTLEVKQPAELIRMRGTHWHFRFEKLDTSVWLNFTKAFLPGVRGVQMQLCEEGEIPLDQNIQEFWMSDAGDFVTFQSSGLGSEETATICFDNTRVQFDTARGFLKGYLRDAVFQFNEALPTALHDEFFLFLVNIRSPSQRISDLIERVTQTCYKRLSVAG